MEALVWLLSAKSSFILKKPLFFWYKGIKGEEVEMHKHSNISEIVLVFRFVNKVANAFVFLLWLQTY